MDISIWDHLNERHADKLNHTQRTVRHGIVFLVGVAVAVCLKMAIDALLGNNVEPDEALAYAAGGALVAVVFTAIELVRGPRTEREPEPYLTDAMRRRVR